MQDLSSDMGGIYDTTTNNAGLTALFIGIIIFSLILSIIMIISYWKIFKKKGKPGWAILVPIYNVIVQIQVANLSMIYFLLLLIPFVNIYAIIKINISLAKSFNKSTGFGIGLLLLPIIFVPLLAFSEEENKKQPTINNNFNAMNIINENNNDIDTNTVNDNVLNNSFPTIENVEIENNNIPTVENGDTTTVETENNNAEIPVNNNESVEEPAVVEPIVNETNEVENNIPTELNTNIDNIQVDNNMNETQNDIPLEIPINENTNLETNISKENVVPTENNISNNETINAFNMTLNDNVNNNLQTTEEKVEEEKILPKEEPQVINAFNSKPTIITENNDNQTETIVSSNTQTETTEVSDAIQLNNNDNQAETSEKTITDNKKYCKNCGNEMPSIVSICPKCGTDNE